MKKVKLGADGVQGTERIQCRDGQCNKECSGLQQAQKTFAANGEREGR